LTHIAWPNTPQTITYAGRPIDLEPASADLYPMVSLKLGEHERREDGERFLRSFLSALSWIERKKVHVKYVGGGGRKMRFGRGLDGGPIGGFDWKLLPSGLTEKQALALALYREAISSESLPYEILSFYKIINILHRSGPAQVAWINSVVGHITDPVAGSRLHDLRASVVDVGQYLYESCRCAVAHAFQDPIVNPDDPDDLKRLYFDRGAIQALAEYAIEKELGVKSRLTLYREGTQA
jgi:hypothetical protein